MGQRIFRAYIDDSGEKEYGWKTSRYFVYLGAIADLGDEEQLNSEIAAQKVQIFGTDAVELKSNWLRRPRERRKRYLDRFAISEEALDQFVEALYSWMEDAPLTFVAAAIDKPQMRQRYGANAWHPSATAYQFLLQRFELYLRSRVPARGYVTVDDMTGSSPAHNQWRDLLRDQHRRLKRDGCSITNLTFDAVANHVWFGKSHDFHLLQIADLVAYNVFRQFRDHGDTWDDESARSVPIYPRLDRLLCRFLLGPNNRLQGWGIVKWPNERKSPWRVEF
jgi:hypothetical protein